MAGKKRASLEGIYKAIGGVATEPPPIPDWLNSDAVAEWNRIVPPLCTLGLLTSVDMATLAAYCQAYAMWKKAEQQVEKEGLTVRGNHGEIKAHPLIRVCTNLLTEIRRIAAEFGFTPAARASMGQSTEPPNAEKDEFASFIAVGSEQVGRVSC